MDGLSRIEHASAWCGAAESGPAPDSAPSDKSRMDLFRGSLKQPTSIAMEPSVSAPSSSSLTRRPQWQALQEHAGPLGRRHLRELFAADPARGERLQAEAAGLYLDYSKQRVTDETLRLLLEL